MMPTKSVYIGDIPKLLTQTPDPQLNFDFGNIKEGSLREHFRQYTTSYDEWFRFNAVYLGDEGDRKNLCYLFKDKGSYATMPSVLMPDRTALVMKMKKLKTLEEVIEEVEKCDVVHSVLKYTPLMFDFNGEKDENGWYPIYRAEWYITRTAKKDSEDE